MCAARRQRWDTRAFQHSVEDYLRFVDRHGGARGPDGKAPTPTSEAGQDLAVGAAMKSGSWTQPLFVLHMAAVTVRQASDAHLRALARLLPGNDVVLPMQSMARSVVEASARVLHLLDPVVTGRDRLIRALNEYVRTPARLYRDAPGGPQMRTKLKDAAEDLGIPVKLNDRGELAYFGPQPPMGRGKLLETYAKDLLGGDRATLLLWSFWSQSSHVDVDSGFMSLLLTGNGDFGGSLLHSAACAAAGAHVLTFHRESEYFGRHASKPYTASEEAAAGRLMQAMLASPVEED